MSCPLSPPFSSLGAACLDYHWGTDLRNKVSWDESEGRSECQICKYFSLPSPPNSSMLNGQVIQRQQISRSPLKANCACPKSCPDVLYHFRFNRTSVSITRGGGAFIIGDPFADKSWHRLVVGAVHCCGLIEPDFTSGQRMTYADRSVLPQK